MPAKSRREPAKTTETVIDETVEESFPASDPPSHSASSSTDPAPSSGFDADAEARRAKISERAHALWEEEGRPDGRHAEHWQQAERETGR